MRTATTDAEKSIYHAIAIQYLGERGMGFKELAEMIGDSRQSVNQSFRVADDFKLKRYEELLAALGCEIVVRDVGYQKVSPEYMDKLLTPGSHLRGLFWCEGYHHRLGSYFVCDNREGNCKPLAFQNKEQMMEWLKATVEARGGAVETMKMQEVKEKTYAKLKELPEDFRRDVSEHLIRPDRPGQIGLV